jgi:hypothetical protein
MFGARPETDTACTLRSCPLLTGPVPQCGQYWILSGGKAYTCSLMKVRRGLFPPFFFVCLLVIQRLPDLLQREESRLNISAIGGSFARIQSSIIVHLA